MVIVMPMVVMIVVVIPMVFVIPVPFMYLPPLLVVVVVGVGPVGAGVGWPLPGAGDPDIAVAMNSPIAIDPDEVWCRHRRPHFIADWRRRGADIDLDLAVRRYCQGRCREETA